MHFSHAFTEDFLEKLGAWGKFLSGRTGNINLLPFFLSQPGRGRPHEPHVLFSLPHTLIHSISLLRTRHGSSPTPILLSNGARLHHRLPPHQPPPRCSPPASSFLFLRRAARRSQARAAPVRGALGGQAEGAPGRILGRRRRCKRRRGRGGWPRRAQRWAAEAAAGVRGRHRARRRCLLRARALGRARTRPGHGAHTPVFPTSPSYRCQFAINQ